MPDAANSLLLLTAEESADEARARLLAQVTAAAAAAPGAGKHLAHGHPRDVALPVGAVPSPCTRHPSTPKNSCPCSATCSGAWPECSTPAMRKAMARRGLGAGQ